jgi:hypothetical protein
MQSLSFYGIARFEIVVLGNAVTLIPGNNSNIGKDIFIEETRLGKAVTLWYPPILPITNPKQGVHAVPLLGDPCYVVYVR